MLEPIGHFKKKGYSFPRSRVVFYLFIYKTRFRFPIRDIELSRHIFRIGTFSYYMIRRYEINTGIIEINKVSVAKVETNQIQQGEQHIYHHLFKGTVPDYVHYQAIYFCTIDLCTGRDGPPTYIFSLKSAGH